MQLCKGPFQKAEFLGTVHRPAGHAEAGEAGLGGPGRGQEPGEERYSRQALVGGAESVGGPGGAVAATGRVLSSKSDII